MSARLTIILLVVLGMAAAATGCGGSNDGATGASNSATVSTSSLSKDEFIKQAGAACQLAKKDILEQTLRYLQQHTPKKASTSEEAVVFAGMTKAVVLPTVEKEIAAIRKLGAPSGDEDEVGAFVASEEEAIAAIAKLTHIASRFQMERYFAGSVKLAHEYGLGACANG